MLSLLFFLEGAYRMKFCINFNKKSKILNKVDEINVKYDRIQDDEALASFCKEHSNQRLNICFDNMDVPYLKSMLKFQKENPDYHIYIKLPYKDEELGVLLKDYPDAKIYFDTKVNDWDRVLEYIDYGVTDIYIVEGLGFELEQIAEIAHNNKVSIRVFPNVAQSSWNGIDDLLKFWIRPEDIDFYSQYVDTCEFYGEDEKNDILYNIYSNDKKWFGELKEIIIGLESDIDSRYIVPRFVKKRVKCGRQCMKGGNCQMCQHIRELSDNLEKAGLMVTMEEKEEESNG